MKRQLVLRAFAALAVIGAVASWYGWSRAQSSPGAAPVLYSGYLEDAGVPVTGARAIGLNLWTTSDTANTANRMCQQTPVATPVTSGWFTVALDTACLDAIHRHPALYLEFVVDSTSFPIQAIGAVPYAIRASEYTSGSRLRKIFQIAADGSKEAQPGRWWDSLRGEECTFESFQGTRLCRPSRGVVAPTVGTQCVLFPGPLYSDPSCTIPTTQVSGEQSTVVPKYVGSTTASSGLATPGQPVSTYCAFAGGCLLNRTVYPPDIDIPASDFVSWEEQHE